MEKKTSLTELRKDWEPPDKKTVYFLRSESLAHTVYRSSGNVFSGRYTCIRYFELSGSWYTSVDKQEVNTDTMLQWLQDEGARELKMHSASS